VFRVVNKVLKEVEVLGKKKIKRKKEIEAKKETKKLCMYVTRIHVFLFESQILGVCMV
jgi:hypothetical protein